MKKILTPATKETAVYYSDFSGKCFDGFGPNAELTLKFNYGSKYDSSKVELHLSDNDAEQLLEFLKTKLSKDCVDVLKKSLYTEGVKYSEAMDFRDWTVCEQLASSRDMLTQLTD